MEIQVLRKKSKDDSKQIAKLKYENEDLQCCLMSSMEDNDSLKKQIKELKENNVQEPSVVIATKENLKMQAEFADLKSIVGELNSNLLKVGQQNDALLASNNSLLEKISLLENQVKEQTCKASVAEFEVESLRRCKDDLTQKLQSLEHKTNIYATASTKLDNNAMTSTRDSFYNKNVRHSSYQGFGSPNVSITFVLLFTFL